MTLVLNRRGWMLGAAIASGSTAWPALAQDGFDRPPEAPQVPPPAPLAIEQTRLPNGLRVVVLPRPGAPRTAIRLIGEGGWLRDPAGKEGLAEVALSMLAQGAKRDGEEMESADIAYAGDLLGLPLRLELTPSTAELALEALPDQCDDAVNLMADLTQRPLLAFEALEHIRSRAVDALVLRRADALLLAPWAARRQFWGRAQPVQTTASLKRLRREDVLGFHRQYWRPERAVLLFAGDLTLQAARGLAEDFMGDWRVPKAAPPGPTPALALASAVPVASVAQFLPLPQGQGGRLIVQTPVPRGTPPALRELARTLMQQRLAARLPWPWECEMESLGGALCWRMSVTLPVTAVPDQLAQLREQLPLIAAEPVTPDDLALAQALALGDWQAQLAEAPDEGLASALAAGEGDDFAQWPQRVKAVSAPVLQLLMAASWRDNRTHLLLLGDAGPPAPAQRAWPGLALTTMRAVIGE
ncbi:insulinase family protein [Mitsuaria sp. GD03876]|uniref:M16 family metallopeptidase n=1 Tax=Mitsuaria sp. GD03876 TaxID=2975399 RepID=UPI00244692B9|nr:insulinase family protein [Mitsuaria sp. GD03876]MDH0863772.1 insulinase family protein [Mitsuaria sp. GD03876]